METTELLESDVLARLTLYATLQLRKSNRRTITSPEDVVLDVAVKLLDGTRKLPPTVYDKETAFVHLAAMVNSEIASSRWSAESAQELIESDNVFLLERSPESKAIDEEAVSKFLEYLSNVDSELAQMASLNLVGGMSGREIAQELGKSNSDVIAMIKRLRREISRYASSISDVSESES